MIQVAESLYIKGKKLCLIHLRGLALRLTVTFLSQQCTPGRPLGSVLGRLGGTHALLLLTRTLQCWRAAGSDAWRRHAVLRLKPPSGVRWVQNVWKKGAARGRGPGGEERSDAQSTGAQLAGSTKSPAPAAWHLRRLRLPLAGAMKPWLSCALSKARCYLSGNQAGEFIQLWLLCQLCVLDE